VGELVVSERGAFSGLASNPLELRPRCCELTPDCISRRGADTGEDQPVDRPVLGLVQHDDLPVAPPAVLLPHRWSPPPPNDTVHLLWRLVRL
jgi:hypothetical protein